MTTIINLIGGPCVGKSSISAAVFARLKQERVSCELVTEVAKDIVYEETHKLLENQIYVFSEQFRRQYRLNNKVDFVITDCPLVLNSIYFDHNLKKSKDKFFTPEYQLLAKNFFDSSFCQFDNIVYVLERQGNYDTNGRVQTFEEAIKLDNEIVAKLNELGQSYTILNQSEQENINIIVDHILLRGKKLDQIHSSNELY